eukprot:538895-Pelagomonas_calceolata.AAC.3
MALSGWDALPQLRPHPMHPGLHHPRLVCPSCQAVATTCRGRAESGERRAGAVRAPPAPPSPPNVRLPLAAEPLIAAGLGSEPRALLSCRCRCCWSNLWWWCGCPLPNLCSEAPGAVRGAVALAAVVIAGVEVLAAAAAGTATFGLIGCCCCCCRWARGAACGCRGCAGECRERTLNRLCASAALPKHGSGSGQSSTMDR